MAYEHDIFLSYRRDPETLRWIKEHFQPILELRVGLELNRRPQVYIDTNLESGTSWTTSLGLVLGKSRTVIVLWTGNYLASVWCTNELTHMLGREKEAGLRTLQKPHGVVIPAFIHDGDRFPPELQHIQRFEIKKCFNVRMAFNSPLAEELDTILTREAPAIAACINNAPAWRKSWPKGAVSTFFQQFHQRHAPAQTTVPRFTG